jgi:hypothetical protein
MVNILGIEVPNQLNELTVQQFETITTIHADTELDAIDKYLQVFEFLGVPTIKWDDVEIEEFKEIVKSFNDLSGKPELVSTLELDGYTYVAFEDKFKLSVKDTKSIEKIMNSKHKGYLSELLAVLFKRTDLTKVEHYTDAHIKLKSKLIRELKAELAVPYLVEIGQKLSKHIPKDAPTEIVE